MVVIFLIAHLIVSLVIIVMIRLKEDAKWMYLIPAVVCVPVCGALLFLLEAAMERTKQFDQKDLMLDKLKIQDIRYQKINVEEQDGEDITIPLEEAMMLNDSTVKRKLLKDILHKQPEKHIDLLQRARLDSDTELTHYATTTMVEIQTNYEKKIKKLQDELLHDPKNIKCLERLSRELRRYIDSGLISGNILIIYRRQLAEVLETMTAMREDELRLRIEQIENQIEMRDFDKIEERLARIHDKWRRDERVYQLYVKYYWTTGNGAGIQSIIDEIKEQQIYLSKSGEQWFEFWSHKEAEA